MTASENPSGIAAEIDFRTGGNQRAFERTGFSVEESFGTWTLGTESSIVIPRSGDPVAAELSITLRPCLAGGSASEQRLKVQVNGCEVYSGKLKVATAIRLSLPAVIFAGNRNIALTFEHPDAIVPAFVTASSDTRRLGFQFERLSLRQKGHLPVPAITPTDAGRQPASPVPPKDAEVHVGKDGWLFLTGGTNEALRYYTDPDYFTDAHAQKWVDLLIARRERLAGRGIRYLHIAAPDKISVYPEMFDGDLPGFSRHPIRLLQAGLDARGQSDVLINPFDAFSASAQKETLYLKTDTHWSYYAGVMVLAMVTERLGQPRNPDLSQRMKHVYHHTWDLGAKVTPPAPEEYFWIKTAPTVERFYANDLAVNFEKNAKQGKPVLHGSVNVAFRNSDPAAIQQTVVIFGDSFMDFQDSNTTVIFAENFREVHFIWSPRIDYSYVERVGAGVVITETAERFMISIPKDDYDVVKEGVASLAFYERT
jgi:hypothetical protein